ncbi:unnamed protein product [Gongylonema pulchrum]|uniref:TATA box-binding protein-associated factor RNA polymerase I subunit B n=1 Tax=Gongylonema pulchrum TaxID=637853 RepID=A0A183DDM6_9BILA|nr:unnamed protein product [Gongylonema pulchrum]
MSGCCRSCGSTDFTLVDGFFYCAVCNTQSEVLREFDHEESGNAIASAAATKLRQKKKGPAVNRDKGEKNSEVYRFCLSVLTNI